MNALEGQWWQCTSRNKQSGLYLEVSAHRCACVLGCRLPPKTRATGDPASLKIELRYPGEAVATHHRYKSSSDVKEGEERGHLALSAPPAQLLVQPDGDETF